MASLGLAQYVDGTRVMVTTMLARRLRIRRSVSRRSECANAANALMNEIVATCARKCQAGL